MANPTQDSPPRRRFAPIPIETTFDKFRKTGPAPELTPEPSPRSPSPPPKEKRKFAPQLIESTRRSRRTGDAGPTTKPTDKTDITPFTKHIYAPKSKRRFAPQEITPSPVGSRGNNKGHRRASRRESCDEQASQQIHLWARQDAEKETIEDMIISAFPNAELRLGGAEHFWNREGSGSDEDDGTRGRPRVREPGDRSIPRRRSSEKNWAFKEMQEHAEQLAKMRGENRSQDSLDAELDSMDIEGPPEDPIWTTNTNKLSISSPLSPLAPIGEHAVPLITCDRLPSISEQEMPDVPPESPPIRPIGESVMPFIHSAPASHGATQIGSSSAPVSHSGFRNGPFGTPFGNPFGTPFGFRNDRSPLREPAQQAKRASPPMLGDDLTFRTCPSPKQTRLEPGHLWNRETGKPIEPNRDVTGQGGLWHGYCYTDKPETTQYVAPIQREPLIMTPMVSNTPGIDPFDSAFSASLSEEPTPTNSAAFTTGGGLWGASHSKKGSLSHATSSSSSSSSGGGSTGTPYTAPTSTSTTIPQPQVQPQVQGAPTTAEHRPRSGAPKGLHMLHGLEERLRKEKAHRDLEEKIAAEFDDAFVTQVYNYLSLGYPAMARAYDEELSKISRVQMEDLERGDAETMSCVGHMQTPLEMPLEGSAEEKERCPRWRALKRYIFEWARQHPDLDTVSPMAWGMAERRGSWAL